MKSESKSERQITVAVILAAGSSSRLGKSKQLVKSEGVPLLFKTAQEAIKAKFDRVIVVLGFNNVEHKRVIAEMPVEIVINPEWQKGMGSSLKFGISYLLKTTDKISSVVILVCDQPLLTSLHLENLRGKYDDTKCAIVASKYNNTLGVPVMFSRELFQNILEIKDEQGAKTIIERFKGKIEWVDWPEGKFDIDTPEDLKALHK